MRYCKPIALFVALAALIAPAIGSASVGIFDSEMATQAYLDTLQGEARERSDAYFEGGYWLILWGALVAIAVECILLRTGLSAKFRDLGERITKRRWLVPAIYAVPYIIISTLIVAPWTIYTGFFRERQYDLMNLTLGAWLGEQAIGLVIGIIGFALFLIAFFAVVRRAPRRWWLWGTGVSMVFLSSLVLIAPFLATLFNEYAPMEAGPLRDRIIAMAEANYISAEDVYVFDQSRQHDRVSANVSGLFGTTQISLNDNLIERSSTGGVEAVMAHEMGHYRLNHVWIRIGSFALLIGFGLFLIAKLSPRILARHGGKWGVRGVEDPAVLPLFSIILTAYLFVMTPVLNTMIRIPESQADAFGLEAAQQPDGFAETAMMLSEYRKIEPSALEEFIFYDHPSGATRVRMAMDWKAENVENPQMVTPDPLTDE